MSQYNAADLKAIRKAAKLARQAEADRDTVVSGLVSTITGRAYVHDLLIRCHIFSPSFNPSALAMAFAEGERNVGLQILADVMRCAPDQYVQMMREYNDRSTSDYRRSRSPEDFDGRDKQPDSADSGNVGSDAGGAETDYDLYGDTRVPEDNPEPGTQAT